jgi:hypothetical protein
MATFIQSLPNEWSLLQSAEGAISWDKPIRIFSSGIARCAQSLPLSCHNNPVILTFQPRLLAAFAQLMTLLWLPAGMY